MLSLTRRTHRARALAASGFALVVALLLTACASPSSTAKATATAQATATATPACVQLVPGATPFTGVSGVSGLSLPSGAYLSSPTSSGGGAGQYHIATYTACFQGAESAIDGFSGSTLSNLQAASWALNNLFPDPTSFSYLDYCSNSHNCVNTTGAGAPFTFLGFQQYASHPNGYTTFTLQVATIGAPSCLNDPTYYSGAPAYTIYQDGNTASSSGGPYHFQMPPGTRVSTFNGGGTAGSTYVYYCSAGTQASVVSFLQQSLATVGWAISGATASGFTATTGSGPTYTIAVSVQSPNNYTLRIFVPM